MLVEREKNQRKIAQKEGKNKRNERGVDRKN